VACSSGQYLRFCDDADYAPEAMAATPVFGAQLPRAFKSSPASVAVTRRVTKSSGGGCALRCNIHPIPNANRLTNNVLNSALIERYTCQ
jgi:hypothetical protein